jgi:hypothetical protein
VTRHKVLLDMRQIAEAGEYRYGYTPRCRVCGWLGVERAGLAAASAEGLAHEQETGE